MVQQLFMITVENVNVVERCVAVRIDGVRRDPERQHVLQHLCDRHEKEVKKRGGEGEEGKGVDIPMFKLHAAR